FHRRHCGWLRDFHTVAQGPAPPTVRFRSGLSMADDARPHHLGHRQRLREKILKHGATGLADYELLELILFGAIPRVDVKPIAKDLLRHFGSFADVISANQRRSMEVEGVGDSAAAYIKAVQAASLRLLQDQVLNRPVISAWDALLDYCRASMA